MKNESYKTRYIGARLYLVDRTSDGKNMGITISGNYLGPKGLPWQVRWTDIFSTEHITNHRTLREAFKSLGGR
jgi:hypothetical protein